MTLEEFERRLKENSPNYQNSKAYQLEKNNQTLSQYFSSKSNVSAKDNYIDYGANPKEVLKAPISKTLTEQSGINIKKMPHNNTFGENFESALWGALHLSKPIAKIGLTAINEATPYISNNQNNIENVKNSFANGDILGGLKNTLKTSKDIILAPVDYFSDKVRNGVIDTALNIASKNNKIDNSELKNSVDKLYNDSNFNIINQEKYGKSATNEEIQQIIDEEYGSHIKNENVANVSSVASDITLEISLSALGVPRAVSGGVVSGLSTYGDTNDGKQIAGSTARGAIFGLLADGGGKLGESVFSKIMPNYGKNYLATIFGNAVTQGVSMPVASEVSDRVSLRIIKGNWKTTEEEEKQINQSASIAGAVGILTSPFGAVSKVKKYKNSLPTAQNLGNVDSYNEAMKKLDEINYTLKNHTEATNNQEGVKKWANKKVAEILEGLDDNAIESLKKYFEQGNPNWYSGASNFKGNTSNVNASTIKTPKNISSNATENTLAPIINNKVSIPTSVNSTASNVSSIASSNVINLQNKLINSINKLSSLDIESRSILTETIKQTTSESLLNDYIPQVNEMIELQRVVDAKAPTTTEKIKGSFINYSKEKIDNNVVNDALNLVKSNNQGKRTKEQWLQIAEQIGINAPLDKIDIYANKTWLDLTPNQKSTLNRQGKSYVSFTKDEWINKVKEASNKKTANVTEVKSNIGSSSSNPIIVESTEENDLAGASRVYYNQKNDDGDIYVLATDIQGNTIYEANFLENNIKGMNKHLGKNLTEYIKNNLSMDRNEVYISSSPKEVKETDYMMSHRPSESNAYASDISNNGEYMPVDVYEHPEYYFDNIKEAYSQESLNILKKIKDNPNSEVTIYRATTGDKINEGDWVTLSKKYAEHHKNTQLDGKGNIVELKVKAKDIQFAGDDINEFGYFPNSESNANEKIRSQKSLLKRETLFRDIDSIRKELEYFSEAKDKVSRNIVENISKNLNIEKSDKYEKVENIEMELKSGKNQNPNIVKIDNIIEDYSTANKKELRKKIIKEALELFRDKKVLIKDVNSIVQINKSGITKTFSKDITQEKIQSYNNISDILEEGIYVYSTKSINDKENVIAHHFFTPVKYEGENGLIRSVIKEFVDNPNIEDKYYYHQFEYIDLLKKDGNSTLASQTISKALELPSSNNIIPSSKNYVNNSENSENVINKTAPTKEDADLLWKDLVNNSTEDAKDILENSDLTLKQGRKNTKIISNDENLQVSNSGNIYPDGNKPTPKDFNRKGLENHFKRGDKRLAPIDKDNIAKGYKSETWIGNQWKDTDKVSKSDLQPKDSTPFIDENGKTKTLDFISDNRKKEKISINELKDFMVQRFVNKGHYVDKLADKTNNPELKYAFDKTLSTYGEANYSIGVAQTDNNGKEIGKSIIDIFKPSEDANLYKEFNDYLINRHNLDRQALGKAVYDESITSEDSRKIIQAYETSHPEFKEWAEDVYTFNRNELHNLVEEGFISKELEESLHDIYGNYIPLHRDIIDIVNQAQDSKNTGAVNPIKRAKGGSQNILNIKDAMAENVLKNKKAIRRNQLGKQLAKSTGNEKNLGDFGIDAAVFTPDAIMNISDNVGVQKVDGKYLYTVFVDGEIKQFKINDDLYESLRADTIDMKIRNNKYADKILSPVEKVTKAQRDILTTYSIGFALNNPIKDFQDGLFYSKYGSLKFISNYGKALKEIATNGNYYKDYMALGGNSNSYFEYGKGIKKETKNPISKVLNKVQRINEILEMGPRLSEYISTIESGGSKNEAMYNASDITTDFKRGGEYTKLVNKYGANFLNASVQGLDKVIRTFSGKKTAKEWARLFTNVTILTVAPTLINYLIYKDDEEYQNLESYIKDEYYLIKTSDDGKFIRIPKGRIIATISATARRIIEGSKGGDFDVKGLGQEVKNQLAPNNPTKDNVFAPIMQVATNTAWYGGKIVPTRLENQLPKNQHDEKTDKISLWLGENLNISPIKINYLIDQYSGGIGDIILPMLTPRAENNIITDKFTTDSVLKNKNVGEFYDNLDMYEKLKNDSNVSEEDTTKYNYLSKISTKVGKLYNQKREIQMDNSLTDSEKKKYTREVQQEINMYCENANNLINSKYTDDTKWKMYIDGILSDTVRESDNSSVLQDALYIINNSIATKKEYMYVYDKYKSQNASIPTMKTLTKLKENNIKLKNYAEYDLVTKKYESDKDSAGKTIPSSLTAKKVKYIYSMNISDKEKNGLLNILAGSDYSPTVEDLNKLNGDYLTYLQQSGKINNNKISAREKYMSYVNANIPVSQLNKYYNEIDEIEGKKDANGKTISGTKKQAIFNFVNSLSLNIPQKKLLLSTQYDSFKNEYYQDVFNYINSLKITKEEKQRILNNIYN